MRSNSGIAALLWLLVLVGQVVAAGSESAQPLRIRASIEMTDPASISFTITNVGAEPVALTQPSLPWGDPHNVVLVLVNRRTGETIRKSYPIQDYFGPPDIVSLAPGKYIRGMLNMVPYVEELKKLSKKEDIIAFWYYEANAVDGRSLGKFGGWLEIPRRKQ